MLPRLVDPKLCATERLGVSPLMGQYRHHRIGIYCDLFDLLLRLASGSTTESQMCWHNRALCSASVVLILICLCSHWTTGSPPRSAGYSLGSFTLTELVLTLFFVRTYFIFLILLTYGGADWNASPRLSLVLHLPNLGSENVVWRTSTETRWYKLRMHTSHTCARLFASEGTVCMDILINHHLIR